MVDVSKGVCWSSVGYSNVCLFDFVKLELPQLQFDTFNSYFVHPRETNHSSIHLLFNKEIAALGQNVQLL